MTSNIVLNSFWIIFQLIAALLVADFFSGILHWLEDRYLKRHWPVVGSLIVAANDLHHKDPRAFTKDGFLLRNWASFLVAGLLMVMFVVFRCVNVFTVGLVLVSCILPTQAHYWAHRTMQENGPVVGFSQRLGLLQSSQQHWRHHRGAKDNYFCTMTDYVNPILEKIRFFQRLEAIIDSFFGVKPKLV